MNTKPIFEDDSEYLQHYGVLGMKWGIRHNRKKTAQKVAAVLEKNRSKAAQYKAKVYKKDTTIFGKSKTVNSAKWQAKRAKAMKKVGKYSRRVAFGYYSATPKLVKWQNRAAKYDRKANGLAGSVAKAAKYNAKAAKLEYKADKLERAYKKQLSKLEDKDLKKGAAAVDAVLKK